MKSEAVAIWASLIGSIFAASSASDCPTKDKIFNQKIDHSDSYSGTFHQRYQIHTDGFKPEGPILFYQGNEAPITCIDKTILPEWANETGSMVVGLEHRYFGESLPTNETDLKKRFKYLTLDNVLKDSAAFIEHIKQTVPGAKDSLVISNGGSYGGFLAGLLRMNHPESFHGAIATSPMFRDLGADYQNPASANWYNRVSEVYEEQSYEAASKIKSAFAELMTKYSDTSDYEALTAGLGLCRPIKSATGFQTLLDTLMRMFSDNLQFSYRLNASLPQAISRTLAAPASDALAVLNASASVFVEAHELDCFPGHEGMFTGSTNGIEWLPFEYIQCAYFPFAITDVAEGTIFPPHVMGKKWRFGFCEDKYGVPGLANQTEIWEGFNSSPEDLFNAERLLVTVSGLDPAAAVAPLGLFRRMGMKGGREGASVLWVDDAGHVENLYASHDDDKEGVIIARNKELQTIKKWIDV